MANLKYLTKADYTKCKGWHFRINFNGQYHRKWFNASKLGGLEKAKKAAIAYRDKFIKDNHLEYYFNRNRFGLNRAKNSHIVCHGRSPIIGVGLQETIKPSGIYYSWTAYWQKDRNICRKRFSVLYYGYIEAFQMACLERYRHCGILIVKDKKYLPAIPKAPYKIVEKKNGRSRKV